MRITTSMSNENIQAAFDIGSNIPQLSDTRYPWDWRGVLFTHSYICVAKSSVSDYDVDPLLRRYSGFTFTCTAYTA